MYSLFEMSREIEETIDKVMTITDMMNHILDFHRNNGMPFYVKPCKEAQCFSLSFEYGNGTTINLNLIADNEIYHSFRILPSSKIVFVNDVICKNREYNNWIILKDEGGNGNKGIVMLSLIDNYKDFLKTYYWNCRRTDKLKQVGNKCQLCSATNTTLNVHHNTYDRIGREEDNDLIVLCSDCHKKFHNII